MRGDRPFVRIQLAEVLRFTPHARGSTPLLHFFVAAETVYPACAGIDLTVDGTAPTYPRLPRMRGDRPSIQNIFIPLLEFTPHARGSTVLSRSVIDSIRVYPACAGIDPPLALGTPTSLGLPRMRGDRPECLNQLLPSKGFTPHARGSTVFVKLGSWAFCVYPACAGIDPSVQ